MIKRGAVDVSNAIDHLGADDKCGAHHPRREFPLLTVSQMWTFSFCVRLISMLSRSDRFIDEDLQRTQGYMKMCKRVQLETYGS